MLQDMIAISKHFFKCLMLRGLCEYPAMADADLDNYLCLKSFEMTVLLNYDNVLIVVWFDVSKYLFQHCLMNFKGILGAKMGKRPRPGDFLRAERSDIF